VSVRQHGVPYEPRRRRPPRVQLRAIVQSRVVASTVVLLFGATRQVNSVDDAPFINPQ
jgi:hypothetical protein